MENSDKLIRILNRERRELKDEVNYLRYLVQELTIGDCDHSPIFPESTEERQEEETGPMLIDSLVKEILMG